ncbi:hypothetical protein DD238_001754 [Peronospora effusa]|uniref:MICOS complex subunit n=1 Tax=Peronospora effusa TaxID=542832 RepID=A0A3M6VKE0_9STRA|nr:hypothetical protein DD238_001754 [Peronospora effusa]RQM14698.1 hypothetical protein DD237_005276 [Peronospora effusa]
MDTNDKMPGDAALGAVSKQQDEASKNARTVDTDSFNQARDVVKRKADHVKELTSAVRDALDETAQQAWEVTKMFVTPVVDVFKRADGEEGTELRKYVGVARERLNVQLYAAQMQLQETKKIADDQFVPVKNALQQRIIGCTVVTCTELLKSNEFRREYPEVAAIAMAVVVGVPSLLIRGKWSAVRNSAVAVGAGAAACYRWDKSVQKKRK